MSKNLLKAAAISAAMASALVAGDCSVKSGAYAGISAGVSHLGGKNEYAIVQTAPAAGGQNSSDKANLSKASALGTVFAGYGMKISSFWAGLELFYQFDNLKTKNTSRQAANSGDRSLSSKSSGAYGADIHLGVLANDKTVAYLIAGIESRKFKVKFSPDNGVNGNFNVALSKGYTSIAFAPGLGVRFNIAKNLALRTEYKLAMHKDKKMTASAASHGGIASRENLTVKHKPQVHSFQIGAVYSF